MYMKALHSVLCLISHVAMVILLYLWCLFWWFPCFSNNYSFLFIYLLISFFNKAVYHNEMPRYLKSKWRTEEYLWQLWCGKALFSHSEFPPAPFHSAHSNRTFPLFPWQRAPFLPLCASSLISPHPTSSLYLYQSKQKAGGLSCDVVRVEVEESLTKEHLLETFISCGRKTHEQTHRWKASYLKVMV